MKLFVRYNRINLLATVLVFLLSSVAFYLVLRYVLVRQVDEDLKIEQREIQSYAAKHHRLPEIIAVKDQYISYHAAAPGGGKKTFSTQPVQDAYGRSTPFRQLDFFIDTGGSWYRITVSKSLESTDNMLQLIASITLSTILLMLVISLLVNRLVLRRLWQPFNESLHTIRNFELGKKKQLRFPETDIEEFSLLNETLQQAISKADRDYIYLREFTENASHELQTPLAIVQSKLDVLIQDEQLSEKNSRVVQGAYEAIQRLSRLNQGLLLLTKIENGLYNDTAFINFSQKIEDKLIQFAEMIASKNIHVTKRLDSAVSISMNPALADILLNNLLSNAIKYNVAGGAIDIRLSEGLIEIGNTGRAPLDETRLFRRFAGKGDGIGLGLAMVQQVAAISGFNACYAFADQMHCFRLTAV